MRTTIFSGLRQNSEIARTSERRQVNSKMQRYAVNLRSGS
jgi:hypothetical protein